MNNCFPGVPSFSKAWLLLMLDVSVTPPRVLDIVIRSEEQPSTTRLGVERYVVLTSETGPNYGDAERALRKRIAEDISWAWVGKTLKPPRRP